MEEKGLLSQTPPTQRGPRAVGPRADRGCGRALCASAYRHKRRTRSVPRAIHLALRSPRSNPGRRTRGGDAVGDCGLASLLVHKSSGDPQFDFVGKRLRDSYLRIARRAQICVTAQENVLGLGGKSCADQDRRAAGVWKKLV